MTLWPVISLLTAGVAIGLYMGLRFIKGERNKPILIGVHVLLGLAALEPMAMALRGDLRGASGTLTLGALVFAFASGAIAPLIGKSSQKAGTVALGAHVAIAATAYILVLLLASRLPS